MVLADCCGWCDCCGGWPLWSVALLLWLWWCGSLLCHMWWVRLAPDRRGRSCGAGWLSCFLLLQVWVLLSSLGMVLSGLVRGFVAPVGCLTLRWSRVMGDKVPLGIVAVVVGRQGCLEMLTLWRRCWRERFFGRWLLTPLNVGEGRSPTQPFRLLAPVHLSPHFFDI